MFKIKIFKTLKQKEIIKNILIFSFFFLFLFTSFNLIIFADNYSISGTVMDYGDVKPIIGATVTLKQGENVVGTPQTTDNDGNYTFTGVTSGDYTILVTKVDEPYNPGVEGIDLLKIRRHLIGHTLITNLYEKIAANLFEQSPDTQYAISGLDLIKTRQKIVGSSLITPIWRFFDESRTGELTATNYLEQTFQQRSINNLTSNLENQDFIAVKMGDVNNDWNNYAPISGCGNHISYEGQDYGTVQIGNQCWMAENLNVGNQIDSMTNQTNNSIKEKYCYDATPSNCNEYGGLYQWDEAMDYSLAEGAQGICPDDWHIPTEDEYSTLITYLGGTSVAGGGLKEQGNNHWDSNTSATNISGFTAFGGGMKSIYYTALKVDGRFWFSKYSSDSAYQLRLRNTTESTTTATLTKTTAISIRCIKN